MSYSEPSHRSPLDGLAGERPYSSGDGAVHVHVRVTPKASANQVRGVYAGPGGQSSLKVYVTAPPDGDKANAAVIRLLAREWRIPKSHLTVVDGAKDRRKVLRIADESGDALTKLNGWWTQFSPMKGL